DADPDNVIAEADENNVGAYDHDMSVVNGYRADPVDAGSVPPLGPTTIALQTTTFDDAGFLSPGPREFEVVTPPAGGTLDQPAGTWFSAASVQYTPNPGFSGPDSFTVAARDASSPYPLHPRSAAVTLNVQSTVSPTVTPVPYPGTLGISGAPVRVYTASTTPLSADGPGVEQGVTWSVDGTVGGSAASGTISADGVFHAPAAVPPAGRVVVGARSATGATGQVSIGVGAAPHPRPAPGIKPPPVPAHGLSRIKLREHARTVLAVVSSAQRGRVRFVGRIRGRRFGGCSTRVSRGGAATCKMRAPATNTRTTLLCRISRTLEVALPPITVRASLTHGGRVVARRHAAL
ncbi:MAG: large repetitive protein, partial [Solirubrobacteraceae bacterium]|nr:large repetitive protein [Solirubrobacteraceae bacterium]